MPQEVIIWGIGNLKKVEKMNHDTGIKETQKRCTGTVEFPTLASEAGWYEDKKVYIYTEAEHLAKGENPLIKLDALIEYTKTANLALLDMSKELEELKDSLKEG